MVVDGRMRGRTESINVTVLLLTLEGEGVLMITKMSRVVDGREGGWVKNWKIVNGC